MRLEQISEVNDLVYVAQRKVQGISGDAKAAIILNTYGGGICYEGVSYDKSGTDANDRARIEYEMEKLEKAINKVFYR